jgi:hypothetical protein
MDTTDPAYWIGASIGTALIGLWSALRKPPQKPRGDAEVLAMTIMERQIFLDLMTTVRALDGTMRVLIEYLEEAKQARHDEQVARDAIARHRRGDPPI